jgi:hypothetical protein
MDMEMIPELAYPTMTAPGEEKFAGDDPEIKKRKYDFRTFSFRLNNVQKQADSLIADLDTEREGVMLTKPSIHSSLVTISSRHSRLVFFCRHRLLTANVLVDACFEARRL